MKKFLSLICTLIAIVMMALPFGVAMTFAPSPTERVTHYYSYLSLMPIGYGNWFPFITMSLSIMVALLMVLDIKKPMRKIIKILLIITLLTSLLSWMLFNAFSVIGLAVFIFLAVALILQFLKA